MREAAILNRIVRKCLLQRVTFEKNVRLVKE
jgi:hypothetical protein